MRILKVLVALLCISSAYGEFTANQMDQIVLKLNKIRLNATPKSLNSFNEVFWDNTLFNNAFAHSQTCQRNSVYSAAGSSGLYGETILHFDSDPTAVDIQDSLSASRQYYNYDDTECTGNHDCTPYTNIVWNSTYQVGCSKNACDGDYIVVCNFNPPGSFSGVAPYEARQHDDQSVMSYSDEKKLLNLNHRLSYRDEESVFTQQVQTSGSYDWRDTGVIGYPKDSLGCAAGWAFTAVGIYESRAAMRSKKRYDLSDQQVIDCIGNSNYSIANYTKCSRYTGDLNKALLYIQTHGIEPTSTYPYVGPATSTNSNQCAFNQNEIAVQGGDIEYSQIGRDSIVEKCRSQGPVGVGIYVTNEFLNYAGGIFYCNNSQFTNFTNINHNVLLVGYNAESNYYIIKNNFGRSWGENGFARINADPNNDCLIGANPAWSVQI